MVNPKRPDDNIESPDEDTEGHGPVRDVLPEEENEDTEGHGPIRF